MTTCPVLVASDPKSVNTPWHPLHEIDEAKWSSQLQVAGIVLEPPKEKMYRHQLAGIRWMTMCEGGNVLHIRTKQDNGVRPNSYNTNNTTSNNGHKRPRLSHSSSSSQKEDKKQDHRSTKQFQQEMLRKDGPLGGILGDEMGLGKTLQMIALCMLGRMMDKSLDNGANRLNIASDGTGVSKKRVFAPTLLVVPRAVVHQWRNEIMKCTKLGDAQVWTYYGIKRHSEIRRKMAESDEWSKGRVYFVITTYDTLLADCKYNGVLLLRGDADQGGSSSSSSNSSAGKRKRSDETEQAPEDSSDDDGDSDAAEEEQQHSDLEEDGKNTDPKKKAAAETDRRWSVLFETNWDRIVLDEASSRIRSRKAKISKAVKLLRGRRRWCVTGTPYNNNLDDLASLCDFIGLDKESSRKWWKSLRLDMRQAKTEQEIEAVTRDTAELKKFRDAYILVRTKSLLNLPPVTRKVIGVTLGPRERQQYDDMETKAMASWAEYQAKSGHERFVFAKVLLVWLLRLQQTSCHWSLPLGKEAIQKLLAKEEGDKGDEKKTQDNKDKKANVVTHNNKLDALLADLKMRVSTKPNDKIIIFSQWTSLLDIVQHRLVREGIAFLRLDGQVGDMQKRSDIIDEFGKPVTTTAGSGTSVLLSQLKVGGLGLNLTMACVVYFLDKGYNPAVVQQAITRVDRIGQTKPVTVLFIQTNTNIEEVMESIHVRKISEAQRYLGESNVLSNRIDESTLSSTVPPLKKVDMGYLTSIFQNLTAKLQQTTNTTATKSSTAVAGTGNQKRTAVKSRAAAGAAPKIVGTMVALIPKKK